MEKEFTEGDAFVAAYSEYFGVVYLSHIYSLEVNQNSRLEHGCLCSQGTER